MLIPSVRRTVAGALGAALIAGAFTAGALPAAHAEDVPTPAPTTAPAPEATPEDVAAPEPSSPPPSAPEVAPAPAGSATPDAAPEAAGAGLAPAASVPGTAGNAAKHWPLVITEINGDNEGTDNYEYLEVVNTTAQPIDLDAAGIQLRYHTSKWNAGTVQPLIHLAGENDSPAVIPAGGVAVFWMNYGPGDTRQSITKEQFRDFYQAASDVQVFRFGPQGGFANSGNRGFSITDAQGRTLSRAWVPADDGNGSTPWNAQFAVPDAIGSTDARLVEYDVTGATANPTPGTITLPQVTSKLIKPTDPTGAGPILQITEVAPDTANVSGSDAYEFIEVYNASDAPVGFGDYVLNYLATDNDLTGPKTTSSTLWPAGPGEPRIEPGQTLVLWIQNPAVIAAGYTVDDFNREFGTALVLGKDILTIASNGMANGGSRGLQLMTKSGHDVSRAYYFTDDQTTPTTAIQYAWNPANAGSAMWAPANPAGTTQTMLGLAKPTPGSVTDGQVSGSLVPHPAAGAAPRIVDLTDASGAVTGGVELVFDITDDVLVRRVTLTVTDDLGGTDVRNLTFVAAGRYRYAIPAVDLYGKRWVEYSVAASDGSQLGTLAPKRIVLDASPVDPVRLNVADGEYVNGRKRVVGTTAGDPAGLGLSIGGAPVTDGTPSLEKAPRFAIEATATDAFFRNGIKLGDEVLRIFDEGYYDRIVTVDADVPVDKVLRGKELTIGVYAGTKAWPNPDPNENNDDFTLMNPRLALPDGRMLRPTSCASAGEVSPLAPRACPADSAERVNLNDANLVYFLATFTIPDDAFDSVASVWDTTAVADGPQAITASAAGSAATRTVVVDNTAPQISSTLTGGTQYRGDFTVDAAATDAGSGFASLTAVLDGKAITLPNRTSSLALKPGDHTAVFTATDKVGNTAKTEIAFSTADEKPRTELVSPADGAVVKGDAVDLVAIPGSNKDDRLQACFAEGYTYTANGREVRVSSGSTMFGRSTDRGDAVPLSEADLAKLAGVDGVEVAETSTTALPYQLFTVAVPAGAGTGADARVSWAGSANADAKVLLYVRTTDGSWQEVDRHVTTGGAPTSFTLNAQVPVDGHATDGELVFLVQHSEGWAGTDRSTRASTVTPFHSEATPRDRYDFTFAWETDTQYYNANQGRLAGTGGDDSWYRHQLNINEFLLKERDNLNLQYVTHTGDIVDSHDQPHQWKNADAAYRLFDEARLPYGVLAGNHDVGHFEGDYGPYSSYFGTARFGGNPWYGGSYKDNRGHYDLVSADGVDLLMMFMGWPDPNNTVSNSEDIAWMNSVIAQYPERKVILNLHEFMLTTGGLGPFPQRILDEVIAPNPNVIAVGSGHYHDAFTRVDDFDDDGDGVADRTVYAMLFDYQSLAEGGLGYLRLLHFDNEGKKISVRTYSPSLGVFNSDEPSLNSPPGMQEFELPYAAGGIVPKAKTLATDALRADILTTKQIGCVDELVSGEKATVSWKGLLPKATARAEAAAAAVPSAEHGWYVRTTGPFGGVEYTEVRTFTATGSDSGGDPDGGSDGGNPGTGSDGGSDGGTPGTGGSDGGTGGGNANGSGSTGANGSGSAGANGSGSGTGALATTGLNGLWIGGIGAGALVVLAAGVLLILRGRRKA